MVRSDAHSRLSRGSCTSSALVSGPGSVLAPARLPNTDASVREYGIHFRHWHTLSQAFRALRLQPGPSCLPVR